MPTTTAKPYPDFPLTPHPTGQWCKKIKGKLHYFGKDADEALRKYLDQRDDLQAGRTPRAKRDGLTVADLGNAFLRAKRTFLDAGELSHRTWQEYYFTVTTLCEAFGRNRLVDDLHPDDFEKLRAKLAETRGAVALGNEIQRVRTVFKYGFESGAMPKPVLFGQSFRKPNRKAVRQARNEGGSRMMEAAELRTMLDAAGPTMKAMMLLALNCGFGQGDLAALPMSAIDLKAGWVNFPRPKTQIPRRCPLWKETIAAVRASLAKRPKPRHGTDPELIFITKYGKPWVRFDTGENHDKRTVNDSIGREFAKLATEKGIKRRGSFYNLRHVHRTIADAAKDPVAADSIMGHAADDMASRYRETIDDDRLRAVVNVVRAWLFPPKPKRKAKPVLRIADAS